MSCGAANSETSWTVSLKCVQKCQCHRREVREPRAEGCKGAFRLFPVCRLMVQPNELTSIKVIAIDITRKIHPKVLNAEIWPL